MTLLGNNVAHLVGEDGMPDADADLVVVLDTCAWSQLENLRPYIEDAATMYQLVDEEPVMVKCVASLQVAVLASQTSHTAKRPFG